MEDVEDKTRVVHIHATESARSHSLNRFCSNELVTSKYTIATFLPINLFGQFSRAANLYFLLIVVFQVIPGLSPTGWVTTVAPLAFVLAINATKEAYEDYKRHCSDNEVNNRTVELLSGDTFIDIKWSSVSVGDIIRVQQDSKFPADLVLLFSSDIQGLAYVETASLDGETNFKTRNAFYRSSASSLEDDDLSLVAFTGLTIECEQPNNRLYQFEGAISLENHGVMPLDVSQILLRGATLRNTQWVVGAVVFTGADTKYMQNMIAAPRKVSQLEKQTNFLVISLFFFQIVVSMGLAIGHAVWLHLQQGHYYLLENIGSHFAGVIIQFIRFMILLNQLIPISLYVTLEFVKVLQCYFLNRDIQMFHELTNTPAQARTTYLNEELGQVEYVLSDKTGTLTQNVMAFVRCSIGGVTYGNSSSCSIIKDESVHTVYEDQRIQQLLQCREENLLTDAQAQRCHAFFYHLAICHTVVPVTSGGAVGNIKYQATSPDEEALVQGAALCGYQLIEREPDEIAIDTKVSGLEKQEILAVLEFTSERKRMSIICKDSRDRIKLYCKGADSVILKRISLEQSHFVEATVKHLEEFAHAGYRTLCLAEREVGFDEFEKWAARFRIASISLEDREEKLAEVADSIERELVLLGATAVEDKLQDGVPETITLLAQAGIKVWVLTGDKLETAVSIGLASNLLVDSMHLFLLSESCYNSVPQMLLNMVDEAEKRAVAAGTSESDMAVVIEGASLANALEEDNRLMFWKLSQYCRSIICCRVSPLQKAQVTNLVKEAGAAITLAIGDGANDVGMIRAAQIGVGISGREGIAAASASDYAISQFKYLARLLLVHGRWSHRRNMNLIMYMFYKNIVYVMGNFYLSFYSAFSAQANYHPLLIATFNLFWTSLPIMVYALFDKDVSSFTVENNPQLYMETQKIKKNEFLINMMKWAVVGSWHSIVAYFFPRFAFSFTRNGVKGGLFFNGVVSYALAVIIVNIKAATMTHTFTWISHCVLWIVSIGLWFLLMFVASVLWKNLKVFPDLSDIGIELFCSKEVWVLIFLATIAALMADLTFAVFHRHIFPLDSEIMQEIEHGWREGKPIAFQPFVERVSYTEDQISDMLSKMQEAEQLAGQNKPEAELVPEPKPVLDSRRPSKKEGKFLPPRRLTWREVVSEAEIEDINVPEALSRYGKQKSSGFQIVTSLSDTILEPRPLVAGPLPPLQIGPILEQRRLSS